MILKTDLLPYQREAYDKLCGLKIGALYMDVDEILRLKQITGLADLYKNNDFSRAWVPGEEKENVS